MLKKRRNLFVSFFLCSLITLSSIVSKAQEVPNYLFLEVIDSNQKPIVEATIEMQAFGNRIIQTDENGAARTYLPNTRTDFTYSLFKISKPGYFPFQDLGTPMNNYDRLQLKLELLKIPGTEAERLALGNEQMKRELMWAVKTGDAATARKLLKTGLSPNLNSKDLRGVAGPSNIPAILFAAASQDGETVKVLLEAGAKINLQDTATQDILAYYLQFPSLLPTEAGIGKTARIREYVAGAKRLIKAGAKIDNLQNSGQSALFLAARRCSPALVKFLLDKKLPINQKDRDGSTALMSAIRALAYVDKLEPEVQAAQLKVIDLLIKAGADVNARNSRNESALTIAIEAGRPEIIKRIIDKGVPLNETNYAGMTALMYAIERNEKRNSSVVESAKLLLEAGADPNISVAANNGTNARQTALIMAASIGNLELMRMLIAKKADVNYNYADGYSALSAAASGGGDKLASVKLLIEAGANVKGKQGSIALKVAKMISGRQMEQDVLEFLKAAGAK